MTASSNFPHQGIIINLCKQTSLFEDNLNQFINTTVTDPFFLPILIFCDDLRTTDEIFDAVGTSDYHAERKKIIIVKNKKGVRAQTMWDLLSRGIYDIVDWSSNEDVIGYIKSLQERNEQIAAVMNSPLVKKNLIGECRVWKYFLYQVIETALFTKSPVLLIGESGTGKELFSRLIHTIDTRPNKKDLVLVDCTTIVSDLSGSEFFGHEKGSYTNAMQSRDGAFSLANNGTLFLDEIGDLPLNLQAELLRVIQEGTFKKVGSHTWQKTNFRLVSATNRDIRSLSNAGGFRQDLYFRISDFECKVPSLAERREDIPLLAKHFLKDFFPEDNVPEPDELVLEYLMNREYPGNIRDLRQIVRRMALKHLNHKKISIGEIPEQDRPAAESCPVKPKWEFEGTLRSAILSGYNLRDLKNRTMEEAIKITVELCNGDKTMAAKKLGVTPRALQQFRKKNKVD